MLVRRIFNNINDENNSIYFWFCFKYFVAHVLQKVNINFPLQHCHKTESAFIESPIVFPIEEHDQNSGYFFSGVAKRTS